jgi:hypothetical protein
LSGADTCNIVDTSGVVAAVDEAASGAVVIWKEDTGTLVQNFASGGWYIFRYKSATLQCADVMARCTLDAQASSSDQRRILILNYATAYLTGLVIRGGYLRVSLVA